MTEVPVTWWFDGNDLDATAYAIADNPHPRVRAVERARAREAVGTAAQGGTRSAASASTSDIDALVRQLREQEAAERILVDDGPDDLSVTRSRGRVTCLRSGNTDSSAATPPARRRAARPTVRGGAFATDPTSSTTPASAGTTRAGLDRQNARNRHQDAIGSSRRLQCCSTCWVSQGRDLLLARAHKRDAAASSGSGASSASSTTSEIVWVKPTPVFGQVYWHFQHSPA